MFAPTASRSAWMRCCPTFPQAAGWAIITTLLSAEAVGIARWATDTASGVRQDPRAVRPPDRPVPGDRHACRDDRHHRAGHRRGVGCRPGARRGRRKRLGQRVDQLRVRRRGKRPPGPGRRPALRPGLHPSARRYPAHRSTTPTSTTAAPWLWWRRSAARRSIHSGCSTPRRPPGCAR